MLLFQFYMDYAGEDGSIQGLFEMINLPYVGCKILASSIAMDKVYTKIILDRAGISQAKSEYFKALEGKFVYVDKEFNEKVCDLDEVIKIAEMNLRYPMFVKPSNSGSSVGVNRVSDSKELLKAIRCACEFDRKILIEEGIFGKELECAVLGNEEISVSSVGEVSVADEFYSFDAKYKNSQSMTVIPANISNDKIEEIRGIAKKAFKAIDGKRTFKD